MKPRAAQAGLDLRAPSKNLNHGIHRIHGMDLERTNQVTGEIVDSAYKIYKHFGPGLLESVYGQFMAHEFRRRNILFQRECVFPVEYDGLKIDTGLRLDFLVENQIIVELKAIEQNHPVHKAQILSYLKLADKPIGLLINFGVADFKHSVQRFRI